MPGLLFKPEVIATPKGTYNPIIPSHSTLNTNSDLKAFSLTPAPEAAPKTATRKKLKIKLKRRRSPIHAKTLRSRSATPNKQNRNDHKSCDKDVDLLMADRESSLETMIRKRIEELVDVSMIASDCGGTPSSCVTPYLTTSKNQTTRPTKRFRSRP